VRLVAIADPLVDRARAFAEVRHPERLCVARGVDRATTSIWSMSARRARHFELTWAALQAGKHALCEKPIAYDYRDTQRPPRWRYEKGLNKAGFTFTARRCSI
jgi:predicted dehydrogenase